jgi:hypothetical protein
MTVRTEYTTTVERQTVAPMRDLSRRTAIWVGVAVCLVSLWIRAGIPLVAAPVAVHDDQFFLRTANYLLAHEWLGPYDKMTLSKGMFYPLFIAGAFVAAVPLKIAEQLIYLAASGITAFVAARGSRRRWVGLLMLVGLALNPVPWHQWLARVSRESLYIALSLGLFGLVMLISFPGLRKAQRNILLGLGFGLVWGAFWLTREESIWLLPACMVAIAFGAAQVFVERKTRSTASAGNNAPWKEWRPIIVPLLVGSIFCFLAIGSVAALNWHYYGVFRTNEFRSGGFVEAYGALARIQRSRFQRFVPIPLDARQKAYEVSPAARELSRSLEEGQGRGWEAYGCSQHPIPPPCDQQAWFMWAMRDAASETGHYRSAPESDEFYTRIATEINSACDSGKIRCGPLRETFMTPFRWEYVGETLESAKGFAGMVFDMGNGEVGAVPSVGSPQGLATFADITDENLSPPVGGSVQDFPLGRANGWVAGRFEVPTLKIVTYTKREVKQSITETAAPDVVAVHPDLKSVRFTIESDCPVLECDLAIESSAGQVLVPFGKLVTGAPVNTPDLILYIDHAAADETSSSFGERRRAKQQRLGSLIGKIYSKSSRGLSVLAAIGVLVAIMRFRQHSPSVALLALAFGSLTAVASRIILLAYIDVTSFSTYFLHYCSPASPFLIVFVISGIYLGFSSLSKPEGNRQLQDYL